MKITVVAFEGCMTSAVYGQADAFAIAAYIAGRRGEASWSGHEVRIASPDGIPVAGYGGHPIRPHCSLNEAKDSGAVLIPPIFNDIEQTLETERQLISWLKRLQGASRFWRRPARARSCAAKLRRSLIPCRISSAF